MWICLEICFQCNSVSAFDSSPFQRLWPPPVLSSFTPVSVWGWYTHFTVTQRKTELFSLEPNPFYSSMSDSWELSLMDTSVANVRTTISVVLKLIDEAKWRLVHYDLCFSWEMTLLKKPKCVIPKHSSYNLTIKRILELDGSLEIDKFIPSCFP